jgi:hypothetical protein
MAFKELFPGELRSLIAVKANNLSSMSLDPTHGRVDDIVAQSERILEFAKHLKELETKGS